MTNAAPSPQPANPVDIRAHPPSPKRLSRRVLMTGAGVFGTIVVFAVLTGLSDRPANAGPAASDPRSVAASHVPEALTSRPADYSKTLALPARDQDEPRDMLWGDAGPPEGFGLEDDLYLPEDSGWADMPEEEAYSEPYQAASPAPRAETPVPLFFEQRPKERMASISAGATTDEAQPAPGAYRPPASPYELQAGTVIPAALVTAVNSDLPGKVIAQVTAPVYDSVTGDHLLIPQGARLIGTYESEVLYGDTRVFLGWDRIIMPNGWSLDLGGMAATDPSGAAGVSDKTDNHLGRLGGAIALSAVLSIVANEAESDDDQGFTRSVGDAAAQEAARTGGRIVDRELTIRPTLRVRPGAPVRVLVTNDLTLTPYDE
jgi:type IV secretory pathway VirB10-like protein